MASSISLAGSKRVRPWDSCQDVEALKEMLEARETEVECLKTQSAIKEDDILKGLQLSLQEKEGRIQELLREAEKLQAMSAFGKLFGAPAKPMHENVGTAEAKEVTARCSGLQKRRHVSVDHEDDMKSDKVLSSESMDDEDYIVEETPADATDDEEYTVAVSKPKAAKRARAKKASAEGDVGGTGKAIGVPSLRASIQKQIVSQMVYRPGLKHRTSKAVAEVPNLSELHMKAILGDGLFEKASRKGKLIQVTASEDDVDSLFQGSFRKGLRYGAVLGLRDGLKFAFTKATGVLKVTGVYTMY